MAAARLGLDRPLWEQYLGMLGAALRGDFGVVLREGDPGHRAARAAPPRHRSTLSVDRDRARPRLRRRDRARRHLAAPRAGSPTCCAALPAVGVSVPNFWIGLLLIQVFAFTLGWFPAMGSEGWQSLVLPAVTMAIPTAAVLAQVLTRSFDDTLGEPYIATARAKGLSRFAVQVRHAFRNAALPTLDDPRPPGRRDRHRLDRRRDGVLAQRRRPARPGVGARAGHPRRAGDRRARRRRVRRRQPHRRPALPAARSPHRPNPEGEPRMTDLLEKPAVAARTGRGRRMPRRGAGHGIRRRRRARAGGATGRGLLRRPGVIVALGDRRVRAADRDRTVSCSPPTTRPRRRPPSACSRPASRTGSAPTSSAATCTRGSCTARP